MNATTILEERKQEFLSQLEAAQSVKERIDAARFVIDQIACILAQDEQNPLVRQRQQAVLALARQSPALLHAAGAEGEMVITAGDGKLKAAKMKLSAKAAGAALLVFLAAYEFIEGHSGFAVMQLAGSALLMLGSGTLPSLFSQTGRAQARGVLTVSAQELMRSLGDICRAADVCVSDLTLIEKEAGLARLSGTADEAMLDLLVSMMEARASGRQDAAVRTLNQAEQYLNMMGIEVVFYSEQSADLFDVLPTMSGERTIRPALMKDGKVIRRGVAAKQMERSVGA